MHLEKDHFLNTLKLDLKLCLPLTFMLRCYARCGTDQNIVRGKKGPRTASNKYNIEQEGGSRPALCKCNCGISHIAYLSRYRRIAQPQSVMRYLLSNFSFWTCEVWNRPPRQEQSSIDSEIYDILSQVSHVFLTFKLWSLSILLLIFYNRTAYCITASSDFTAQLLQLTCKICCDSAITAPQPKKSGCSRVE